MELKAGPDGGLNTILNGTCFRINRVSTRIRIFFEMMKSKSINSVTKMDYEVVSLDDDYWSRNSEIRHGPSFHISDWLTQKRNEAVRKGG